MAVGNTDNLGTLGAFVVYLVAFRLPTFPEDILSNSAHKLHVLRISGFECVHDFISCHKCLVLKGGVARESIHNLAKSGEVPHEMPCSNFQPNATWDV